MAVQEQTPQIEYVANGVTKSFPLTFDCEDHDHLIVKVNDAELSVGSWMLIDENVSFKVAPTNGSNIVIQRNTPMQRTTTYKTYNNSFRPEPVNKDLDRIWWKLQELGLADWLLGLRIDKEIRDRIAADIYYYALTKKETDQKINDLKDYIDALVNNITGEAFLPILDKYVKTWSGRSQEEKNKETPSAEDFGAVECPDIDSEFNSTIAFSELEATFKNQTIDLHSKQYLVDDLPILNNYKNGFFIVDGKKYNADSQLQNSSVTIGNSAGSKRDPKVKLNSVLIGEQAAELNLDPRGLIAIGTRAAQKSVGGNHNIAIGLESLLYVGAGAVGASQGTRNTAIGANTMRFVTKGYGNVALGRNAMQCITTGGANVAIGANAMAGNGSLKFSGDTSEIVNQTPREHEYATAIGTYAMTSGGSHASVAIGGYAAPNLKPQDVQNIAIGYSAMAGIGLGCSQKGARLVTVERSGGYVMSTNTVTFTLNAHGLKTGYEVIVRIPNLGTTYNDPQYYVVAEVQDDMFTVYEPAAAAGQSGQFILQAYATLEKVAAGTNSIVIGMNSLDKGTGSGLTVVGHAALRDYVGTNMTVVGALSGNTVKSGGASQLIGNGSAQNVDDVLSSVVIGSASASKAVKLEECVYVGRQSGDVVGGFGSGFRCIGLGAYTLRKLLDGSNYTELSNSVAIGVNSSVSGDNQVQIGTDHQHVYTNHPIQNRSDARDKTDIENMPNSMIDFILNLRAVQGVWDMRDDYVQGLVQDVTYPDEPIIPDAPLKPKAEDFIYTYFDGMTINRTDLFTAARSRYEVDLDKHTAYVKKLHLKHKQACDKCEALIEARNRIVREFWSNPVKDGSKKRNRKHNWFIAQEVKSLADQLGIDFAGLQDHKLIDGTDTLTLGYEEFIPPIVATIQKISSRIDEIEKKLNK